MDWVMDYWQRMIMIFFDECFLLHWCCSRLYLVLFDQLTVCEIVLEQRWLICIVHCCLTFSLRLCCCDYPSYLTSQAGSRDIIVALGMKTLPTTNKSHAQHNILHCVHTLLFSQRRVSRGLVLLDIMLRYALRSASCTSFFPSIYQR